MAKERMDEKREKSSDEQEQRTERKEERRESWVVMTTLTASTQQSHHPVGPGDSWSLLNVTLPLDNFEVPGCLRHVESEDRLG